VGRADRERHDRPLEIVRETGTEKQNIFGIWPLAYSIWPKSVLGFFAKQMP
jgi:hypothetical protein